MKRSGLKRKTPLVRGKSQLKRSPLKRQLPLRPAGQPYTPQGKPKLNPLERASQEDPAVRAARIEKLKAGWLRKKKPITPPVDKPIERARVPKDQKPAKNPKPKRSRMKAPKGDPPEIRARRADYVAENPACQYALAFEGIVEIGDCRGKKCCEHIWGRGSEAREHPSAYATSCWWHHEFKTAKAWIGRVLILAYKKRLAERTGDKSHFDVAKIGEAIGRPLVAWLHYAIDMGNLPPEVAAVASRLIRELEDD